MCGIAVCVKSGLIDKHKFDRMTDIVKHRGPDDRGVYYDEGLALGHRRLAIIDTTSDGHQPFEMVDGFVLVFNGEIYNYIELREELQKSGHVFETGTDTEVIVHAYKEWGLNCVERFNGMWSFVLYDKHNRKLFCSRDRYGVKPFYYTNQEGMFLIASEIKQFFEMLEGSPKADNDMLMQYIIRGIIENPPQTMFSNVFQLEPGHNLIYDLRNHSFHKEKYYDISNNPESSESYEEACRDFLELFKRAISLRHRSDVPLGYFLSGGLDSSAIVCVSDKFINESERTMKKRHTISSCFEEKEYDEQEYIDEVIKATDIIAHKVFPDEQTMLEELDDMIWHMDEPTQNPSGFAQWSVCKAAKENGLTVMMDGQGADEQLAGYTDFYTVMFLYALKKGKFGLFKKEVDSYIKFKSKTIRNTSRALVVLTAVKDYLIPGVFEKNIKRFYITKMARLPFGGSEIRKVVSKEFIYPRRDPRAFIKAYMENELLYQLHQGDRYSMAFSIENRNPFLDYTLVDCIYRMPFEYKLKDGYTKAVLRDSLNGIMPEKVRKRISKFGFETPGEKWFTDNALFYRQEFEKSLKKFSGLFDTDRVLRWYDGCKDVNVRKGLMWRIIDSARWMEIFNVSIDR